MSTDQDHLVAAQLDLEHVIAYATSAQAHLAAINPPASEAITDREPRELPALPVIARGEVITDATFGSRILRVTDAGLEEGASFRTPDSAVQRAWNATSTRLTIEDTYGQQHVFDVDGLKVRRRGVLTFKRRRPPKGSEIVAFNGSDCSWHDTHPDQLYGRFGNRIIKCYDVASETWTTVLDLDTLGLGLPPDSYTGSVYVQANHLLTVCGGAMNDLNHWLVYLDLATGETTCLDSLGLTQYNNGQGFTLHGSVMDLTATYVLMQPAAGSGDTTHLYIWEPAAGSVRQVSTAISGHFCVGRGMWSTQDCAPGSAWDAAQWCWRSFDTPDTVTNIIEPVLTPKEMALADHSCWTNMQQLAEPFISATYRYAPENPPVPWRAWDDEILLIHPTTGVVRRQAHHRSTCINPATGGLDYWATPRPNISPDGRFATFTSNWGRTLGNNSEGARQDVFLVELR